MVAAQTVQRLGQHHVDAARHEQVRVAAVNFADIHICQHFDRVQPVNAGLHQALPKSNISIAQYAKDNGIDIIDLTPEEREAFRVAMTPVWNKYRKKIGDDMFDFMLKNIKAHQQ